MSVGVFGSLTVDLKITYVDLFTCLCALAGFCAVVVERFVSDGFGVSFDWLAEKAPHHSSVVALFVACLGCAVGGDGTAA